VTIFPANHLTSVKHQKLNCNTKT